MKTLNLTSASVVLYSTLGLWMFLFLLGSRFVRVLADSVSFCGEGVEHYSRIDEILLHTLQPSIQLLKPHELSSI